jgi:ribonuclease BN (tRNA processing enzyme)
MRVQFVGSGDAFVRGGRWQTCIHLDADGQVLLVDCGATSLVALKARGLDPNAVGAVAVTHLHGDHFGGLPFLILDGQFSHRTAPLLVAGPPGTGPGWPGDGDLVPWLQPGAPAVPGEGNRAGYRPNPGRAGRARVRGWEVEHACGAPPLALRVELGGVSFAYSGDTQWTSALARPARGVDLFAVEGYTFDRPIRYHLDYQTLRAHLGELHAERVVLTHMSAAMLGRLTDAGLPAAYDGMVIDL